ncbi:MAG: hypothetical protein M1836_007532 [Candelina mexicana]|nr:MAG: hypothetical protein M1836_007532 [Candelina mexicana]
MEAAASVIAVVGLALRSTQIISTAIAGCKNASPTMRQMRASLQALTNVLKQLVSYGTRLDQASDLPELIAGCAECLKTLEVRLGKLSSLTDNRAKRYLKNVKFVLQQSDLDRMSALLHQHVAVLSLQVNILECKTISSHTASLERVEELSRTQVVQDSTNWETLERTKAGLHLVHDEMQEIRKISQTSGQSTCQALGEMGDKMRDLAGLSTEQSSTLNTVLELLKQQLPLIPRPEATKAVSHEADRGFDDVGVKEKGGSASDNDSLQDALNRLCYLVREKDKIVYSAEADSIICDIKIILLFMKACEGEEPAQGTYRRRRVSDDYAHAEDRHLQYRHEIKKIKGLLNASNSVAVNAKVPQLLTTSAARCSIKTSSRRRCVSNGKFVFLARRKVLDVTPHQNVPARNSQDGDLGTLEASISFVPNAPQTTQIAVLFQQKMLSGDSVFKKPILSISALLPNNSEVFRLIEAGDLDSLIKKLSLREFSLTDRDIRGRSLLNHAVFYAKPNICRFLIDEGADVDFNETSLMGSFLFGDDPECVGPPAHSLVTNTQFDSEQYPEFLALYNQCRSLLLQAGADPTASSENGYDVNRSSFLSATLHGGTTESLSLLLNHGREFLDADTATKPDRMLLKHLSTQRWTVKSVRLLLRMCETARQQQHNLDGCLHETLSGSSTEDNEGITNILILLIRAGADIHAKDCHGSSVSDRVCAPEEIWWDHDSGTCRRVDNKDMRLREIWVKALRACGYNAEEVISCSTSTRSMAEGTDDRPTLHNEAIISRS